MTFRAIGCVFTAGLVLVAPALLTSAAGAAPSAGVATVRAAHLSPDTPSVDAYLEPAHGAALPAGSAMTYGTVGSYARIPAGSYRVVLVAHGKPATTRPLLSWVARLQAGRAYTLAGEGVGSGRHGAVLDDDLSPPAAEHARVRLIQAASSAGRVNVRALRGPVLATHQAFASATGYASVPAGTWLMSATGSANQRSAVRQSVTVRGGSVYSVVLLDVRGGGVTMRLLLDAAGASQMPGSADTGGGGTATRPPAAAAPSTSLGWTILTLVVLASLAAATTASRRRHRAT